jgi:uncharacterized protein (TIGR00369 family)
MNESAPQGFEPWSHTSPVTLPWEPIYIRETETSLEIGTFIRKAHCNRRGLLHGGVIAALCDIAMGYGSGQALRRMGLAVTGLLTTHLAVDYIGKAEDGWLAIVPRTLHAGPGTAIAEATAHADDRLIAHAKASFRVMLAKPAS